MVSVRNDVGNRRRLVAEWLPWRARALISGSQLRFDGPELLRIKLEHYVRKDREKCGA